MKITITPETPEEIQKFKPVTLVGLRSMLAMGVVVDAAGEAQTPFSVFGNVVDLAEALPKVSSHLLRMIVQAKAAEQPRIAVPNVQFRDGNGNRIG